MNDRSVPVAALLREGTDRLRAAGLAEPRREAATLWAGLGGSAADLVSAAATDETAAGAYRAAVARRARGAPRAYATGRGGFRHLEVATDQRALIPRPETEGLVELVLERAPAGVAADIGTGTGCIALSLRQEGRYQVVLAVDRSADAVGLARSNALALRLPVQFVRADLTTALAPGSLDALVSNPPYLTEAEYGALDASVRDWEPIEALVSGPDGMTATRGLLDDGLRVLKPAGWLALEVDASRATDAAREAHALGWTSVEVRPDLFGRQRYLLAQRSDGS